MATSIDPTESVQEVQEDDDSHTLECQYTDFCDKQACILAGEFFSAWNQFKSTNSYFTGIELKDVQNKFIEFFPKHFTSAIVPRDDNPEKLNNGASSSTVSASQATAIGDSLETTSDEGPESPCPRITSRPFFRKLSFRGLRKRKGLFMKQHSDEVQLSPLRDKLSGTGYLIRLLSV